MDNGFFAQCLPKMKSVCSLLSGNIRSRLQVSRHKRLTQHTKGNINIVYGKEFCYIFLHKGQTPTRKNYHTQLNFARFLFSVERHNTQRATYILHMQ